MTAARVLLVVEDDEFTRRLIARMLLATPYQTSYAADSTQALSVLRDVRPDLVLMDIRLPGLDGLALTRRFKAMPHLREVPVLMMTGDARRDTVLQSREAGAAAFIVKPFDRVSLLARLQGCLPP